MDRKVKLLFPVDLSTEVSVRVAPDVIKLAGKLDAEVHLLLVSEGLEKYATFYIPHPSIMSMEREIRTGAERKLEEFQEMYFAGFPAVKRAILQGKLHEVIMEYIRTEEIDMVVVGTHGRTGLDRMIFGSTADVLVRDCPVPVVVINPYARQEKTGIELDSGEYRERQQISEPD